MLHGAWRCCAQRPACARLPKVRLAPWSRLVVQYLAPPHIIVRKGLIEGRIYPHLAPHLASFLAETLFHTSLLALPSDELRCAAVARGLCCTAPPAACLSAAACPSCKVLMCVPLPLGAAVQGQHCTVHQRGDVPPDGAGQSWAS